MKNENEIQIVDVLATFLRKLGELKLEEKKILEENYEKIESLLHAGANPDYIHSYVDIKLDINDHISLQDYPGITPIKIAAQQGWLDMVILLSKYGAYYEKNKNISDYHSIIEFFLKELDGVQKTTKL